ncbi:hypothetical protein Tco_0778799, partial [Tanacetum coccineum]
MYRSAQAMHMLTKPQVFYDDTHKQAFGYQNPFNLKKAQQIKSTLYDGNVIAKEHAVISVIDDEETLILEEEKQAFWLKHSNYNPDISVKSHTPVRIEAPSELPKVNFGAWGFEHTKACFVNEIIPFLKVLKDTFNAFDKTLLDEITEVQTVFNQMEAAVDQCSVDNPYFQPSLDKRTYTHVPIWRSTERNEILYRVDGADFYEICDDLRFIVINNPFWK